MRFLIVFVCISLSLFLVLVFFFVVEMVKDIVFKKELEVKVESEFEKKLCFVVSML